MVLVDISDKAAFLHRVHADGSYLFAALSMEDNEDWKSRPTV